jgi:predicted nucleotide-binding protein
VSHGGSTASRQKLVDFIRALGAEPVLVEHTENLGTTPNAKVRRQIEMCDYGVVLATANRGAKQDSKTLPRGNVIDECARLQSRLGDDHVLILRQQGVTFPSNTAEFVHESFTPRTMDKAFTALVRELRSLGLLQIKGDSPSSESIDLTINERLGRPSRWRV